MNPHLRIYFLGPDLRRPPSRGPNFDLKYCLSHLIFKLSIFKLHLRTQFGSYHFLLVYFSPVLFTDLLCPAHEGIWVFKPLTYGLSTRVGWFRALDSLTSLYMPGFIPHLSVSGTFISCHHLMSSHPPSLPALVVPLPMILGLTERFSPTLFF